MSGFKGDDSQLSAANTLWDIGFYMHRKMIRRLATPDLMFGHVVAPPLSKTKDSVDISDVLGCFNETGSPVLSELSPIAMVTPSL